MAWRLPETREARTLPRQPFSMVVLADQEEVADGLD
jgi:hypothetical protein